MSGIQPVQVVSDTLYAARATIKADMIFNREVVTKGRQNKNILKSLIRFYYWENEELQKELKHSKSNVTKSRSSLTHSVEEIMVKSAAVPSVESIQKQMLNKQQMLLNFQNTINSKSSEKYQSLINHSINANNLNADINKIHMWRMNNPNQNRKKENQKT